MCTINKQKGAVTFFKSVLERRIIKYQSVYRNEIKFVLIKIKTLKNEHWSNTLLYM